METQIILEKTKFCHLLLSVDLNPAWNTAKSTQKDPTFGLVFHNERLVSETFPTAISLHTSSQTVQVLKSPVALTVWQKNFRSDILTTIKGQLAFDFELVQHHLLSCTVKSIILGHNIVRFVHYCVILQYNKREEKSNIFEFKFFILFMQLNKNRE